MDSVTEVEMSPLVTVTEKLLVPAVVGVPEIAPAVERLRPVGNTLALIVQAYEPVPSPPTAERTWL